MPTMEEGPGPKKRISKMRVLLGAGVVLLVACIIGYVCLRKRGAAPAEGAVDDSRKDLSIRGEDDERPSLETALAGISNHSSKRKLVYTQSWTIWAGEHVEHVDACADTVDETLVGEEP